MRGSPDGRGRSNNSAGEGITSLGAIARPYSLRPAQAKPRVNRARSSILIPGKAWFYPMLTLWPVGGLMVCEGKPPAGEAAACLQPVPGPHRSAGLAAAGDLRKALGEDDH